MNTSTETAKNGNDIPSSSPWPSSDTVFEMKCRNAVTDIQTFTEAGCTASRSYRGLSVIHSGWVVRRGGLTSNASSRLDISTHFWWRMPGMTGSARESRSISRVDPKARGICGSFVVCGDHGNSFPVSKHYAPYVSLVDIQWPDGGSPPVSSAHSVHHPVLEKRSPTAVRPLSAFLRR